MSCQPGASFETAWIVKPESSPLNVIGPGAFQVSVSSGPDWEITSSVEPVPIQVNAQTGFGLFGEVKRKVQWPPTEAGACTQAQDTQDT